MLNSQLRALLHPLAKIYSDNGHTLYLVGGAVRDLVLGKTPGDLDFATDALPQESIMLFKRVLPTGIAHGTVTILWKGQALEVTTFRVDGLYSDGRRPDSVDFTSSLEEDLKRRDFTINALALKLPEETLIDQHQGLEDLQHRRIRAIGNPQDRFQEDSLRMLRACRFAAKMGFEIEFNTLSAIAELRHTLQRVSVERIRTELDKLLLSRWSQMGLKAMQMTDLMSVLGVIGEWNSPWTGNLDFWPDGRDQRPLSQSSLRAAFFAGFYGQSLNQNQIKNIEASMHKLTYSHRDLTEVKKLLLAMEEIPHDQIPMAQWKLALHHWGNRDFQPILDYLWLTQGLKVSPETQRRWYIWSQQRIFLGDLPVGGHQLLEWGWKGPEVGIVLKKLQKWYWEHPEEDRLPLGGRDLLLEILES